MKKFLCLILSAALTVAALSFAVNAEHTGIQNADEAEKSRVLQLLEIMNGDENGNMNLDAPVTRAEFVKMVISASVYKDTSKTSSVSLFPDVTSEHWAAGYISSAIGAGLVSGYLDGTFRPENEVKLEEAVIILLKLLGYTGDDFKGTYPEAQLAKYAEIDLDTDIDAVRGDTLTRRDCMELLYNTLCTKTKTGAYYCQTLGYALDADNTIDALALQNADMTGPFVNTAESWKTRVSFASHPLLEVFRDGKRADSAAISDYDVYYYSAKLRTVWCYTDKEFGKIDAVNPNRETPQSVTVAGKSYALTPAAAKKLTNAGGIAKDDYVMLMLDKDGAAADIVLADAALYHAYADEDADLLTEVNKTVSDPIVVTDLNTYAAKIPFALSDAELLLDGEAITPAAIRVNDVLYYSEPFHTVWVFRDTASGVCMAVNPNREQPTSVTVGAKTYALSTDSAVYKFSNYGTFKKDMLVTLLIGKDGSAVDVVPAGLEVIGDGEDQVSYNDVVNATLKGPYLIAEDGTLPAEAEVRAESAVFYRDNKEVNEASIRKYDVYYYSTLLNTVWLYHDTASGTVESIQPSRLAPTSITVSGKSYTFESAAAQYEFTNLGSYKVGDRVTLLLGKDGAVAGALRAGETVQTLYGVVTATGEKTYTDADGKAYKADYVTVYAANGETYSYEYDGSFKVGTPVSVTVGREKVQISGLVSPTSTSRALPVIQAVKEGRFADGAQIIEYYNEDIYGTVLESRISGLELRYRDILYGKLNENNELEVLILDDATGDLVEYGYFFVDNRKSEAGETTTYSYMLDNQGKITYNTQSKLSISEGPAYFERSANGSISKVRALTGSVEIETIIGDKGYTAKNAAYEIADNVKVFIRESGEFKVYDLDKLETARYTMTGYYDRAPENGGKIRVIVAY